MSLELIANSEMQGGFINDVEKEAIDACCTNNYIL
jgi:hypothetical protein